MLAVRTLSVLLPSLTSSSFDWASGSVDQTQTTAAISHSLFMIVLANVPGLYGLATCRDTLTAPSSLRRSAEASATGGRVSPTVESAHGSPSIPDRDDGVARPRRAIRGSVCPARRRTSIGWL